MNYHENYSWNAQNVKQNWFLLNKVRILYRKIDEFEKQSKSEIYLEKMLDIFKKQKKQNKTKTKKQQTQQFQHKNLKIS